MAVTLLIYHKPPEKERGQKNNEADNQNKKSGVRHSE